MIVVIQCAASKRSDAGRLVRADGKPVTFVAHPELAPADGTSVYARPDDLSEDGIPWRESLLNYNAEPRDNPLGLCPAYQLYQNKIYAGLVDRFGPKNVYILSAGWGLIRGGLSDAILRHHIQPECRGVRASPQSRTLQRFSHAAESDRPGNRFLWRQGLPSALLFSDNRGSDQEDSILQLCSYSHDKRLCARTICDCSEDQLAL